MAVWSLAVLAATAPAAFSARSTLALAYLWATGVLLCLLVVVDLGGKKPVPADPRPWWREPAVVGSVGLLVGALAGVSWQWVAARADACPPAAPFGGCGGERLLPILGAPLAVLGVALLLVLLRVRRGAFVGFVGPSLTAGAVALYHSRVAGSPPPAVPLIAVLAAAGFLAGLVAVARRVPVPVRLLVITVSLLAVPVAQLIDR